MPYSPAPAHAGARASAGWSGQVNAQRAAGGSPARGRSEEGVAVSQRERRLRKQRTAHRHLNG